MSFGQWMALAAVVSFLGMMLEQATLKNDKVMVLLTFVFVISVASCVGVASEVSLHVG